MTPVRERRRVRSRVRAPRVLALATAAIVGVGVATAATVSPSSAATSSSIGLAHTAGGYAAHKVGFGRVSGPLHVAALGDSVPSGYGASSYVGMVGNSLAHEEGRSLAFDNEAVGGSESADTAQALADPKSAASRAVAAADVTVIQVGANDFDSTSAQNPACAPVKTSGCYSDDMAVMKQNVSALLTSAKKLSKPGSHIVVVGYWNDFEDGSVGKAVSSDYVAQGRALARWTNETLRNLAADDGLLYADVYTPFFASNDDVTSLLQADGDHPNAAGHRILADAVLDVLGTSSRA